MNIINPEIEDYLISLREDRKDFFIEMEEEAKNSNFPIIGPDAGNLLFIIAVLTGARNILELGSGFGYSACFFAAALSKGGRIVCTDISIENKKRANYYFSKGNFNCRLEFLVGDAVSISKEVKGEFDIIFNDIDKEQYPETIDIAFRKLKTGGVFITDNILWNGNVTDGSGVNDEPTIAVKKFNRMLRDDPRFFTSFIPLRDGLSIALKK